MRWYVRNGGQHSLRPILILITALQVQRRAIEVRPTAEREKERKGEREGDGERKAGNLKVESIVGSLQTQTEPVISSVLAT